MDTLDRLIGETSTAKANQVYTGIAYRFLACNDIRRNVLACATAALEHDIPADMQELMEQTTSRDDGIVIDNNFSCKLGGISDDTAGADMTIMSDVHIFHE